MYARYVVITPIEPTFQGNKSNISSDDLCTLLEQTHDIYAGEEYILRNKYAGHNRDEVTDPEVWGVCNTYLKDQPNHPVFNCMIGTMLFLHGPKHFSAAKQHLLNAYKHSHPSTKDRSIALLAAIDVLTNVAEKTFENLTNPTTAAPLARQYDSHFINKLLYHYFILSSETNSALAEMCFAKLPPTFSAFNQKDLSILPFALEQQLSYRCYQHLLKNGHYENALPFLLAVKNRWLFQEDTFDVFRFLNSNRNRPDIYEKKKQLADYLLQAPAELNPETYQAACIVQQRTHHPKTVIHYAFETIFKDLVDFNQRVMKETPWQIINNMKRGVMKKMIEGFHDAIIKQCNKVDLVKHFKNVKSYIQGSQVLFDGIDDAPNFFNEIFKKLVALDLLIKTLPKLPKQNKLSSTATIMQQTATYIPLATGYGMVAYPVEMNQPNISGNPVVYVPVNNYLPEYFNYHLPIESAPLMTNTFVSSPSYQAIPMSHPQPAGHALQPSNPFVATVEQGFAQGLHTLFGTSERAPTPHNTNADNNNRYTQR